MHFSELLSDLVFWLPFVFGVFVCLRAWRKTRNAGYLLIMIFFLSPLFGILGHELSRRIHASEWEQRLAQAEAELQEKIDRGEPIEIRKKPLVFPVFETLLAIGVAMSARRTRSREEPVG